MPAQLRPMKLGEILDQGFTLYRRNFLVFSGIALVPSVIVLALHVIDLSWAHASQASHVSDNGEKSLIEILAWIIYFHVGAFIFLLFYPAFVKAVLAKLFEERVSLYGSLRFAFARWRCYLWIDILKQSGQFLIPEGLCVGIMFLAGHLVRRFDLGDNIVLVAFVIITPVVGALFVIIRMGVSLAFAIPAAALEEIGGFKALRRSWQLSRGARMRIALLWTLILVLTGLLWSSFQFIVRVFEEVLYNTAHLHIGQQNLYAMGYYSVNSIFDAIFAPLYPIVLVLIYYDQRVRKEAYDVEQMMEAAGLDVPIPEPAGEATPEPVAVHSAGSEIPGPVADNPHSPPAGESIA